MKKDVIRITSPRNPRKTVGQCDFCMDPYTIVIYFGVLRWVKLCKSHFDGLEIDWK